MNPAAVDFVIGAMLAPSVASSFSTLDQKIKATQTALSTTKELAQAGVSTNVRSQAVNMAALATVATVPFKLSMNYEATMTELSEIASFDSANLKVMSSDLLKLSESVPVSANVLGQMAVAAAQAGIAQNELVTFTQDAAKMSLALGMSAQNAGQSLVGLRTNFSLSQGDAVLLGDAFNHLSTIFQVEAGPLVAYANQIGQTAFQYKLTGQEVGALGTTFASLHLDTAQASTATNALLTTLANADSLSQNAQQALASLGLSGQGLATAFQEDAQGALLNFLQQVKNAPDAANALEAIFGADHSQAIAQLVGGLDTYQQALASVNAPASYQGAMDEEFKRRSQTSTAALARLQNTMSRLAIVAGSTVLPTLVNMMETVGSGVSQVAAFAEANSGLVAIIIKVVAGLGVLKTVMLAGTWASSVFTSIGTSVEKLWNGITTATHALTLANLRSKAATIGNTLATVRQGAAQLYTAVATKALAVRTRMATSAQWRLTAALAANPIGLVVVAVAALAGWFAYAYSQTSSLTGAVSMMWEQFKAVVPAMHLVEAAVTGVWQFFSDLFNGVSLYDAGIKLGTSLWEGVKSMLAGIQEWFVSIWDGITGIFSGSEPIDIETVDPMLAQTQKSEPKTTASTPPSTVAANPAQPGRNALAPASTPAASGPDFLNPAAPNRPGIPGNLPGSGPTVSANFSFSVNGVPDADFARRVLDALKSRKQEFEHLLGSVVNDQRRLTYGS